jgi:hypothetical protein
MIFMACSRPFFTIEPRLNRPVSRLGRLPRRTDRAIQCRSVDVGSHGVHQNRSTRHFGQDPPTAGNTDDQVKTKVREQLASPFSVTNVEDIAYLMGVLYPVGKGKPVLPLFEQFNATTPESWCPSHSLRTTAPW